LAAPDPLVSKRAANRPKDRVAIEALELALKVRERES